MPSILSSGAYLLICNKKRRFCPIYQNCNKSLDERTLSLVWWKNSQYSAVRLKTFSVTCLFCFYQMIEFRCMMSSNRTERWWWWRSSKLASVVSLIHCFPVFPTLSSALQQLNPHLQLFLSNLISFWRLPFPFPSNRRMFDCQKMQKKGPTVNKFKALVRYDQVYGNLEYRIVCLKTILATPSRLNSASFELETYYT